MQHTIQRVVAAAGMGLEIPREVVTVRAADRIENHGRRRNIARFRRTWRSKAAPE